MGRWTFGLAERWHCQFVDTASADRIRLERRGYKMHRAYPETTDPFGSGNSQPSATPELIGNDRLRIDIPQACSKYAGSLQRRLRRTIAGAKNI